MNNLFETAPEYARIREDLTRQAKNERNDCSVIAVSITTGASYEEAHKALAARCRKNGKGAYIPDIMAAARDLGAQVQRHEIPSKGYRYTATSIGKAFPKGRFLVSFSGHIAALIDGHTEDWTNGRRHRVQGVYEVTSPLAPVTPVEPEAPKKPRKPYDRSSVPGACSIVWEIASENPSLTRKEIIALCVKAGVHKGTASTQYAKWLRATNA